MTQLKYSDNKHKICDIERNIQVVTRITRAINAFDSKDVDAFHYLASTFNIIDNVHSASV